jgi:ornithine cyclodeaminase/alanine dehydrogenase
MDNSAPPRGTLLLDRKTIASLLTLEDCIGAVEAAFRAHALGEALEPGLLHIEAPDGEFHIKAGGMRVPVPYFGLKANAGFFQNTTRFGLPNIQGLILLYSAENGYPLAVMDSGSITMQRTGAATAVAAKYLARQDSSVVSICGCGRQGHVQLRALTTVLPIERVNAYSIDDEEADRFAHEMSEELSIEVKHAHDLKAAIGDSDVCVSCTPATEPYIQQSFVRPGTFLAAVGADSPGKSELDPRLLAANTVVVDLLEQCLSVGELHHAVELGLMTAQDVHGQLGDVIAGKVGGRSNEAEIVVFDSTGTALQDTAAAILAYERAIGSSQGQLLDFSISRLD